MCTVSFVPIANNEFILTSNRDERVARGLASFPKIISKEKCEIAAPVDPLASGTWIAASDRGDFICLLNGAFIKHKHLSNYRKSRGLVVMDYFETGNPETFDAEYDLQNIEPFTMVMVHRGNELELNELRWDGNEKHFKKLDGQKFYLWSSVTLYNETITAEKKIVFEKLLEEEKDISTDQMISIHQKFLYEEWVLPPERVDVVSTLSVTAVHSTSTGLQMHYKDLVRKQLPLEMLELQLIH